MDTPDPSSLSFSQAQGYEPLPQSLRLEELTREARTGLWNILYRFAIRPDRFGDATVVAPWGSMLYSVYGELLVKPLDEWPGGVFFLSSYIRPFIDSRAFNEVFDLFTFLMRLEDCPPEFVSEIASSFQRLRLAYVVDKTRPPTILPTSTLEEGTTLLNSLEQLQGVGLNAAHEHLRKAATCINHQDWLGSIRESIHAVESVAVQIAEKASTLGQALKVLEEKGLLRHPALKDGFSKIYGYTSDEQGIRHALLDEESSNVGQDEAVFMLGACASFASYLSRKQVALQAEL